MTVVETSPTPHRWTIDEYHRLAEAGFFEGARVELIEGEILDMAAMGLGHAYVTSALIRVLARGLPEGWVLRSGAPVTIRSNNSEPEPDLAILAGELVDYLRRADHPEPAEVVLAIEVSDTSLRYDRGRKASLYRRSGLAEYWVVDVPGRRVLVHRAAPGNSWMIEEVGPEGWVTVPGTGLTLRTADFLPPPD